MFSSILNDIVFLFQMNNHSYVLLFLLNVAVWLCKAVRRFSLAHRAAVSSMLNAKRISMINANRKLVTYNAYTLA